MVKYKSIVLSIHICCTHENPLLKFLSDPHPVLSAFGLHPHPPLLPADAICEEPLTNTIIFFIGPNDFDDGTPFIGATQGGRMARGSSINEIVTNTSYTAMHVPSLTVYYAKDTYL